MFELGHMCLSTRARAAKCWIWRMFHAKESNSKQNLITQESILQKSLTVLKHIFNSSVVIFDYFVYFTVNFKNKYDLGMYVKKINKKLAHVLWSSFSFEAHKCLSSKLIDIFRICASNYIFLEKNMLF
jgi:hypothetical protein